MSSQTKILKSWSDVVVAEEKNYLFIPYFAIETSYLVTSRRESGGMHFSSLSAADKYFNAEIKKSEGLSATP